MKAVALTAALICLVGGSAGCSATSGKSAYPEQYEAFKSTANQACKDLFKANDAGRPREAGAALQRLLSAKPPPDLKRRWEIFKSDVRRFFLAPDVISKRAGDAISDGAFELGLDECD